MYIDGFVLPVPADRIDAYRKMAEKALDIWMEHGALFAVEAAGDDVPAGEVTDFARAVDLRPGEVPFFSFIGYPDRAGRDRINAAVMADPRLAYDDPDPPFDRKRMIWGGFRGLVVRGLPG